MASSRDHCRYRSIIAAIADEVGSLKDWNNGH